jgi:hypothetical protein
VSHTILVPAEQSAKLGDPLPSIDNEKQLALSPTIPVYTKQSAMLGDPLPSMDNEQQLASTSKIRRSFQLHTNMSVYNFLIQKMPAYKQTFKSDIILNQGEVLMIQVNGEDVKTCAGVIQEYCDGILEQLPKMKQDPTQSESDPKPPSITKLIDKRRAKKNEKSLSDDDTITRTSTSPRVALAKEPLDCHPLRDSPIVTTDANSKATVNNTWKRKLPTTLRSNQTTNGNKNPTKRPTTSSSNQTTNGNKNPTKVPILQGINRPREQMAIIQAKMDRKRLVAEKTSHSLAQSLTKTSTNKDDNGSTTSWNMDGEVAIQHTVSGISDVLDNRDDVMDSVTDALIPILTKKNGKEPDIMMIYGAKHVSQISTSIDEQFGWLKSNNKKKLNEELFRLKHVETLERYIKLSLNHIWNTFYLTKQTFGHNKLRPHIGDNMCALVHETIHQAIPSFQ